MAKWYENGDENDKLHLALNIDEIQNQKVGI
jgi:hypothetical protein